MEATDVAPPDTSATVDTEFLFHLQQFTFSQRMENDPLEGSILLSIGVRWLSFHLSQERGSFSKFWREQSMATKLGFNEIQLVPLEAIHNGKNDHQKNPHLAFKVSFSAS